LLTTPLSVQKDLNQSEDLIFDDDNLEVIIDDQNLEDILVEDSLNNDLVLAINLKKVLPDLNILCINSTASKKFREEVLMYINQ
jgi:hypothetical protein